VKSEKKEFKTFVVSDVHGCYYTMRKLLEKLPENAEIIFVGDLCDRGLHTKQVIEYIIEKGYVSIRGNHEDYMITHAMEAMKGIESRWTREEYMGGKETMVSYQNDHATLLNHLNWLAALPRYIMQDNYFITHSFSLPYFQRRDSEPSCTALMKNRITDEKEWGHDWESDWQDYSVINIFGHTDYEKVEIGKNYYGIDTGCAYGRKLTAIELGTMNIIDEKNRYSRHSFNCSDLEHETIRKKINEYR
jgi:serine/threonine protein phosphatase 1